MTDQRRKHRTANPELAAAMRELRRSSAASRHIPTPRKGTRRAKAQAAIADSVR
ncbi:MAG: hypothetical protein FWD83_03675 [Promicromonosporaceae bacterium]|nr:hypothetical protein [Promicromonosporaceae bacterium]